MAFGTHSTHGKQHSAARPAATTTSTASSRSAGLGHTPPVVVRNTRVTRLAADWATHATTLGLTPSQARFGETFFAGHNGLLSGEAGSGKSYLTQALFAFLVGKGVNVGLTGLTGVASFLIGGQTLHSFAGIGLGDEPAPNLITKVFKHSKAKARIKAVDVLFIDEVSMAKGDLLDKVDAVFRAIRHCGEPFGGVQVCFVADFFQLQPIFRGDTTQELAFQCRAWREAEVKTVVLKEQMRQRGDSTLLRVLNDIRVGDTSSLHLLDARIGATFPADGIDPVRIFCKNIDVDRENSARLAALPGAVKTYVARDVGMPYHTDSFNKNCPAPAVLELKVGAQVALLSNLSVEDGHVNGAVGVVKAFGPSGVTVQFKGGSTIVELNEWHIKEQEVGVDGKIKFKIVATRRQIPLKLAWASTTHRVQGQTLDRAIIDMTEAFAEGQIYVALSRVRDMESLSIVGSIPKRAIRVNPHCVAFYEGAEEAEAGFRL